MYVNNESLLQKDPLASSEMSLHIFSFKRKFKDGIGYRIMMDRVFDKHWGGSQLAPPIQK